ncbi:transferase [Kitasatospora herbaricolor]|uniref:CDP-alcohol phosphatidyltransferase family protein n=1 Tax=Kitasatospora herbaricolor TaxID=68217 RepID=UPI00174CB7E1|nr:CDP-alcohol phosphatidyltransferase family protein [Kitasatospora herbaricolor]MDQ0307369.1 phosphatidylglycerophosphate synthase [Kitasatospora herbaricolor]GGV30495.1 transferase [Kitasatospora herbaricolor]
MSKPSTTDRPAVDLTVRPSIEELRAVIHPEGMLQRRSAEHWAGRLYMRSISLRITRVLAPVTFITPNGLTYLMMLTGILAGAALVVPGLAGAVLGALLIQVYLLLDCVDGEVARWRRQTSLTGVYLDRVGHYMSEAALLTGLGLRAADLFHRGGGGSKWEWAFLGTLAALGAILIKSETDLVDVARARSGLSAVEDSAAVPRSSGVAKARKAAAFLKFHRLVGAVEASLFVLAAGVADAVHGGLFFTRLAVVVLAAVAMLQTVLHLLSIVLSSRLR